MMKVACDKCETLELNAEDRRRIEEIKRELLLHTKHTKVRQDPDGNKYLLSSGLQPMTI